MRDWDRELKAMESAVASRPEPSVNTIESRRCEPWDVLVSTIISLRTKDAVTLEASDRILDMAPNPRAMLSLSEENIAAAIYPAGFYRNKAAQLRKIADILLDEYEGKVPSTREELVALPGVGLKTANLVLGVGFGIPAICVDIHVHRIANRRNWISTDSPDESEAALRKIVPKSRWIALNRVLVSFGQNLCTPVSPHCSICPVSGNCPKQGVGKHR